jgi:hypothetical protein
MAAHEQCIKEQNVQYQDARRRDDMRPFVRLPDLAPAPLSGLGHQPPNTFAWATSGTFLSDLIETSPLMAVFLRMFPRDEGHANGDDLKITSSLIKPTSKTRLITCRSCRLQGLYSPMESTSQAILSTVSVLGWQD